jgi:hypothetical protein
MVISDNNRKRFEAVGKRAIQRELVTGGIQYLGINEEVRNEAKQWVEEREAKRERNRTNAREIDQNRFETIRWWTIIAAVAGIVAAVTGVIAILR